MSMDHTSDGGVANAAASPQSGGWGPPTGDPQPEPAPSVETMAAMVRDLIDGGGPSIVYQPIVHIETGKVLGAEALSRFPAGVSTGEWFEYAGAAGLGADLEMIAARNALTILDEQSRKRLGWEMVGINISPRTLADRRFDDLLSEHTGRHVVLELSHQDEPDWPTLRGYLDRARQLGARIAVNAMATDPAAQFQRLIEIGPDIVKLPTSYTSTLVDNHRRRDVADDFLRMCIRRGVFVIGVGVEQESDLAVLREVGVEGAQGYFLSEPRPLAHFEFATTRHS